MFDTEGNDLATALVTLFPRSKSMIVVVEGTWAVRRIVHCQMLLVH